jgi:hypothetical protein
VEGLAAVQTAVSQHFDNAWRPHAGWAASASPTHSISLLRDHIHQLGIDKAILIEMNLSRRGKKEGSMADLHGTGNPQPKERVNTADLAFVAFLILITAIAVTLTLTQIYLQNPK